MLTDPAGEVSNKKTNLDAFKAWDGWTFQIVQGLGREGDRLRRQRAVLTGHTEMKGQYQGQDISGPVPVDAGVTSAGDGRWQLRRRAAQPGS